MEAYLLKLLDLRLFKHGEDVGAGLLSSPLSLVWGLFTRLGNTTQRNHRANTQTSQLCNTVQYNTAPPRPPSHLLVISLTSPASRSYRRKEGTDLPCLTDGTWTPSSSVMLGWVLCWPSLISRAPIISLRWAPQCLLWSWPCRSDKRWGRLDSSELENWRQEERRGRASDLCCQTLQCQ